MTFNSVKTHALRPVRLASLLLFGILMLLPGGNIHAATGARIFVRAEAAGANNGTSWINAYTSLQSALTAAASGDEVWVAAGTYHPGTDQTDTFRLKNGVALYGGFSGVESEISQRDPGVNLTVLSGDIGLQAEPSDNVFHVVTSSDTDETAVLDGFVVAFAHALGDAAQSNGGGILNQNGSPTLSNLIISENEASFGGGMYSSGSSRPVLTNITFRRNTAERAGGMYITLKSNATLTNVTFDNNSAALRGGGMFTSDSSPLLTNVTFHGNTAPKGGALHNLYGGNPTLVHVTFSGNSGSEAGGAIYNQSSTPLITNSILYNDAGGEIFNLSSTPVVRHSIVQGGYGTNNFDADPLLGPLHGNGGFTETMALTAGSPALDVAAMDNCPLSDPNGTSRPQGAGCDLGAYELDYVAPLVLNVASTAENRTYGIGDPLNITVTFSEAVVVTGTPRMILATGETDRAASYSGGSGTKTLSFLYSVQPNDVSADLEYRSSSALALEGGTIQDRADNPAVLSLPAPGEAGSLGASQNIVIDGIAPALLSFTRQSPAVSPTNADTLVFRTAFSEPVTQVDAADFMVNGAPTVVIQVSTVNTNTYDVSFSGDDLAGYNGVIGLGLSEMQNIEDPAGNPLPAGEPSTDEQYALDNLPPAVKTIAGSHLNPTFASNVIFTVSFTEDVSRINTADFALTTSGVSGAAITDIAGSGSAFTVSVATGAGNGTIRLDVLDDNTIRDSASNALGGISPGDGDFRNGETYTINKSGTISVTVGEHLAGSYDIPRYGSERKSYANLDHGPVKVTSMSGIPMIASQRINLKNNDLYTSYSEVMGMPASRLTDSYIFLWYNNTGFLDSQLRFGNVGDASTVVTIKIGGVTQPVTYPLAPNQSARLSLTGMDSGPVEIRSSNGVPIIAALRINLKTGSPFTSYSEVLGLPAGDTPATRYIFPWYNNTGLLDSQLRFANIGHANTTVTVKIRGISQPQTFTLSPSQSTKVSYPLDSGPVEVTSSGGVPITAALRINLKNNTAFTSYTELMGMPGAALTDTRYIFPWYNNTGSLDSQLRFANAGNLPATVTVKIGGLVMGTYDLMAGESRRVSFPAIDSGPVEVYSSGGVPILAALRINLKNNSLYSSYYELMGLSVGAPLGLPGDHLSSTYWFPWYNNTGLLDSQLRLGVP